MDYKSTINYVSKLRTRQSVKHFAELYNIDLSKLNSTSAMINKIKDELRIRKDNGLDSKENCK